MKPIILLAAVALTACGPIQSAGDLPPPGAAADKTLLDEKSGTLATNAYTAASMLGLRLAQAGIIDRAKFKAADQRGYDAVLLIRKAYLLGNARDYATAIARAYSAIDEIKKLTS